jgi:thiaminase/transcriptional activator TenA
VTASELLAACPEAWSAATHHPFLQQVADGSLPTRAFAAWLDQDYLFVGDLLVFQARLLARAPRSAQAVIAGGLVALEAELTWFEAQGARPGQPRHLTTSRYRETLEQLDIAPFHVAMVGLWAIERAYLDAWASARPGAPPFREFVDHWTVPGFATYVAGLDTAATTALAEASPAARATANATVAEIASLESAFWAIALEAAG